MRRDDAIRLLKAAEPELRARGVCSLAVFGSTARGEARSDSDVDLLIELEEGRRITLFDLSEIKFYASDALGTQADVAIRKIFAPAIARASKKMRCWFSDATASHRDRTAGDIATSIGKIDTSSKARTLRTSDGRAGTRCSGSQSRDHLRSESTHWRGIEGPNAGGAMAQSRRHGQLAASRLRKDRRQNPLGHDRRGIARDCCCHEALAQDHASTATLKMDQD